MSANDRTERIVRAWLAESVEPPRVPEYLPDLVALTAATSQRPAWTLPERWFSMATLTRVQVTMRPVPWRNMALLGLLLVLVGAAAVFYAGRAGRLPAPFGPAANGLVAYASVGDIYTADPRSGTARAITSGPAVDSQPVFSRDGTKIAFNTVEGGKAGVAVVDVSGANRILLESPPDFVAGTVDFSPDGRSVLLVGVEGSRPAMIEAPLDGGPFRPIVEDMQVGLSWWLPPDGRQIVFDGTRPGQRTGIYIVDRAGGEPRALFEPQVGWNAGLPSVSPDGQKVAFTAWMDAATLTARVRVVTIADGSVVEPAMPAGVVWQGTYDWSNDGKSLLVARGYTGNFEDSALAVLPADDLSSRGIETRRQVPLNLECCASSEWAPDDSKILITPVAADGTHGYQVFVDPTTGEVSPVAWNTTSSATWQRLAP